MKAICFDEYGSPDVLELRTVEKPTPRDDEVLVQIHAATVTPGDCELRDMRFPFWVWLPLRIYMGVLRPKRPIIGMEFSGVIESVGKSVTQFQVGDSVFAGTGPRFGTYAEYRCQRASAAMAIKPESISHAEAATVSVGGLNALHYLREGQIQTGDEVLINGAAGCFGTYAIQLAKHFGAAVTGVDTTAKLETMRDLGADHVIDYTREDFTQRGLQYDLILDVAGTASYTSCLRSLKPRGRLVLANPKFWQMLRAPITSRFSDKSVSFRFSQDRVEDLDFLGELMSAGKLRAVIDRRYPLAEVAAAHRYVESGEKIGQVVIDVITPVDEPQSAHQHSRR